jgi:hypothetical protein
MSKVIAPFIFLAIAAGLFFSYTKPAYQALQALQAQEERIDDILVKSGDLQRQRDELWAQYLSFRSVDRERLEKLLPDTIDVVQTIIDLDSIASRYDVSIASFQVPAITNASVNSANSKRAGTAEKSNLASATFTLKGSGDYDNIKLFLADIETSLALMNVSNISVSAPRLNEDDILDPQDFHVSLGTYWLN